jgi:hypothetical protein
MSRANLVIDRMIGLRLAQHPSEDWTRDVPSRVQRSILGDDITVAAESDDGRGAPILDLYGVIPFPGGMTVDVVVSVKTTGGKGRKTGRTVVFTTGTDRHISGIIARMMDPTVFIPVCFAHLNETTNQWVQVDFDAAEVVRALLNEDGAGDYDGVSPFMNATGERGVPAVVRTRTQTYKPRVGPEVVYQYDQIRFNVGPLIERGLIPQWREVDEPEIVTPWD